MDHEDIVEVELILDRISTLIEDLEREKPNIMRFNKAAVRYRKASLEIEKLFKRIRKLTIKMGLK